MTVRPSTDRSYLMLAELPADHPLRSMPLVEAAAEVRNRGSVTWRPIQPGWLIAKASFNQLSGTWLENNEWRA